MKEIPADIRVFYDAQLVKGINLVNTGHLNLQVSHAT